MNEQKGITLVSVVVTVVVILIITVISINSEDGMIEQAQTTTGIIDDKIVKEENRMAQYSFDDEFFNYRGVYNITLDGVPINIIVKSNKIIATINSSEENEGLILNLNVQHKVYTKQDVLELVPEEERKDVEEELAALENELGPIDGFFVILSETEEVPIGIIMNGGKKIYIPNGEKPIIIDKEEKAPSEVKNILEKTKGQYTCYTGQDDRIIIIDYKNEMINTFLGSENGGIGTFRTVKIVENKEISTLIVNGEEIEIKEGALNIIEDGKTNPEAIIDGDKLYVPTSIFESETGGNILNGNITITLVRATLSNGGEAVELTKDLGFKITDLGFTTR